MQFLHNSALYNIVAGSGAPEPVRETVVTSRPINNRSISRGTPIPINLIKGVILSKFGLFDVQKAADTYVDVYKQTRNLPLAMHFALIQSLGAMLRVFGR